MRFQFPQFPIAFWICLGYGAVVWVVQMYRVAPPRDWLVERIAWLRAQITADKLPSGGLDVETLTALDAIDRGVNRPWLLLRVPKIQAGWRFVHGVEDKRLLDLSDTALVIEKLRTSQARLAARSGPVAKDFVKRLQQSTKLDASAKRALLFEAESYDHEESTARYEDIANLLGKAVWLTWVSLGMVVALAAVFGREGYFLVGAAGGLVSRMTRVFKRRPRAGDYGAEWSTLVLSPALGALAGWLGVALLATLANEPFNLLGSQFSSLWSNTDSLLGIAFAGILGFSERLFEQLLTGAEQQVSAKVNRDSHDQDSDNEKSSTDGEDKQHA